MANTVNLYFDVSKQAITRTDTETVASGAINTLVANFDFCETWEGLYKFCRFEGAGGVLDVAIEDDKCVIPWEVIEAPSFTMACYGTRSTDVQLTTTKLAVKVYQSVNFITDEPLPNTPKLIDLYNKLAQNDLSDLAVNADLEAETAARQSADNAEAATRVAADETLQNNISSEASTRAAADTALGARIDNIIAHNNDTSGNTELTDIRSAYDGTNYTTAGAAVRGQAAKLSGEIDDLNLLYSKVLCLKDYAKHVGLIFSDNASVPGSIRADYADARYTPLIKVRAGDTIDYKLHANGSNYANVAFHDSNGAYDSTLVTATNDWNEGTLTIESDGYVRFCTRYFNINDAYVKFNGSDPLTLDVQTLKSDTATLLSDTATLKDSVDPLFDYYAKFAHKQFNTSDNTWTNNRNTYLSLAETVVFDEDCRLSIVDPVTYHVLVIEWNTEQQSDGRKGFLNGGWTSTDCVIKAGTPFSIITAKYTGNMVGVDIQDVITANRVIQHDKRISDIELSAFTDNLYSSFKKVGVIGDSYSAVRLYNSVDGQITSAGDVPFYSWGKFMERMSGMNYEIFAKGGLECATWLTDTDNGYPVASQDDNLCQAYIVCLGINDCARHDASYVGTVADIDDANPDNNANSYVGNYAKIIQKMKALQPNAKFFVTTMPTGTSPTGLARYKAYNDGIRAIANHFDNVYLIDLYDDYYDLYHDENGFFANNVINGHYTPAAYSVVAKIMAKEISKIMYENPSDFALIEFIGDGYGV